MSDKVAPAPDRAAVPKHIAIVMDGNGRWARRRGLPRIEGHRAGVKSVRTAVEESVRHGVGTLTLFAFSSENWKRPQTEVSLLMDLFLTALRREVRRLNDNGVRLRIIGDRVPFSDKLRNQMVAAEEATAGNDRLLLQVAANYGGRWDITQAARRLADDVRAGRLASTDIDERALSARLAFPDAPDPDLFIRTGGERRISNFLLWQSAYAELYFTDRMWPEFDADAFAEAIADFSRRQRRFGLTGDQVAETAQTVRGR